MDNVKVKPAGNKSRFGYRGKKLRYAVFKAQWNQKWSPYEEKQLKEQCAVLGIDPEQFIDPDDNPNRKWSYALMRFERIYINGPNVLPNNTTTHQEIQRALTNGNAMDYEELEMKRESDNLDRIEGFFDKFNDDHSRFERIPPEERRHPRPDICAMIYLHERFGGQMNEDGTCLDAICFAKDDEIWFGWESKDLFGFTEEDALYLTRCGVHYDSATGGLSLFV